MNQLTGFAVTVAANRLGERRKSLSRCVVALAIGFSQPFLGACGGDRSTPTEPPVAVTIDQALAKSGTPGMAAAVVKEGKVEVTARGLRCINQTAALLADDFMHVGSLAKAILAVTAAISVERGELRWESRIMDVLPRLAATANPSYGEVTLADLFRHRGGFAPFETANDLLGVPAFSGTPSEQRTEFVRWLLAQPPTVQPRSAPLYSNAGVIVAAAMIEEVAALSIEALVQERLLHPLGISGQFAYPAEVETTAACAHEREGNRVARLDLSDPVYAVPPWARPAGHFSMSISGYAGFLRFALDAEAGRSPLLGAEAFRQLLLTRDGYAAGWAQLSSAGGSVYWHAGSLVGFNAIVVLDPDHDLAVAAFANAGPAVSDQAVVDTVNALFLTARNLP
jgi:D-alanyl-D-alanine carboxypeptidase